jgi:hypothetical protein
VTALTRACELAPEKVEYSLDLATYYSSEALRATSERKGDAAVAEWVVKFDTPMQQLLARFNQPGPRTEGPLAAPGDGPEVLPLPGRPNNLTLAEKHLRRPSRRRRSA